MHQSWTAVLEVLYLNIYTDPYFSEGRLNPDLKMKIVTANEITRSPLSMILVCWD